MRRSNRRMKKMLRVLFGYEHARMFEVLDEGATCYGTIEVSRCGGGNGKDGYIISVFWEKIKKEVKNG